MNAANQVVRPYLELARVSNLPTVITNVLVGAAIGGRVAAAPLNAFVITLVGLGIGLLYVGGMALNDAADAPFDRAHNPDRPIPSGRVSRRAATITGAAWLLLGLASVGAAARLNGQGLAPLAWGGALTAAIVVYDLVHKRYAASVVLMGACRGLVYLVCAAVVAPSFDRTIAFTIAGVMTAYIIVVTLLARREHFARPMLAPIVSLLLPALVLLPATVVHARELAWPAISMGAIAVVWLIRCSSIVSRDPGRTRDAVMGWLAGICLVDGFFLTLLDCPELAVVAAGFFLMTVLGHRWIAGS